jgi:hypothetical protein
MMNRKTGTRQEWLAARRELLKAEKIGTKPAAFSAAGSPLQLTTTIDNLLSDYARPIVVSNCRWDRTISWQTVAPLVGADCTPRAAADHAIEPALHLHNQRATRAMPALICTIPV